MLIEISAKIPSFSNQEHPPYFPIRNTHLNSELLSFMWKLSFDLHFFDPEYPASIYCFYWNHVGHAFLCGVACSGLELFRSGYNTLIKIKGSYHNYVTRYRGREVSGFVTSFFYNLKIKEKIVTEGEGV